MSLPDIPQVRRISVSSTLFFPMRHFPSEHHVHHVRRKKIMSVIHKQTRTHNGSVDLLFDTAAAESVCPRWFALHVEVQQCADTKLRTATESFLTHFGEKVVSPCDTLGKRVTLMSRFAMNMARLSLLVASLKCTMIALQGSRTPAQS